MTMYQFEIAAQDEYESYQPTDFGFCGNDVEAAFKAAKKWVFNEYKHNANAPEYAVFSMFGVAYL